jgi:iron uptake system component EfeO
MQSALQTNLKAFVAATTDLRNAAPNHAWDDTDPAVPTMQAAWVRARQAYEEIEGATAPIFPDIDTSVDGRIEDFGPDGTNVLRPDCDMFSDQCATGLHAIERILYKSSTPPSVVTYEIGLGYVPPQAYPTTSDQAVSFQSKLSAKAVVDATALLDGWTAPKIDIGSAFQGLISLMNEQSEKVTKAGLHEEESRYSQRTMDDLRHNLIGTSNVYALFRPWIQSKSGGAAIDANILAGFQQLQTLYDGDALQGASLPSPPPDWDEQNPSAADLQTPFGQLYGAIRAQVDATQPGSIVSQMNAAATVCGLPVFTGQ